ncbi:cytochrome P450 [Streptomyces sp. NPDC056660]|uniref:cytochrome P450 n=1 Tax=Streptomyces sp. NPDC056660 TaxID=3345897 RepID=UPI0036AB9617
MPLPFTDDIELDDLDFWTRPAADVDAAFRVLRESDPRRFFHEYDLLGNRREQGFYALTRFADVVDVSRRPDEFISGEGVNIFDNPPDLREFYGSIISMDDPRHARLRRIVSRGFSPRMLAGLAPHIEETTREIVASVAGRGRIDFVTEVAALLPLRIVNDLMGIPRSEERFIFDATNVVLGASDPEYVTDQSPRGVAQALATKANELADLLRELAEARIVQPREDLITSLVTGGTREEVLTPQELASFFILLVGAGNETTRNAIAHGLRLLTEHPAERARWQADFESVAPSAVEEIVRYSSPVLHMRRTVAADGVRLGELEFKRGDKVVMWHCSANRDEDVFDDPDRFDVTRSPNPHIGFGGPGPHFCLGAHLARLEVTIAFRELFRLLPDIRAVGDPQPLRSNFVRGLKHLDAEFTPVAGEGDRR